jgi:hypothetical protein
MALTQMPRYAVAVSKKHTVTPGQTLGHIANIHGVSMESIVAHPQNRHLLGSGPLIPGTRITVEPRMKEV